MSDITDRLTFFARKPLYKEAEMFRSSPKNSISTKLKQLKDFEKAMCYENIANESKDIIEEGILLLEKTSNPLEFDKLLVGTLLYAFIYNDWKYQSNPAFLIAVTSMPAKLRDIFATTSKKQGYQEVLSFVGEKALVDKEMNFDGTFSSRKAYEQIIKTTLPFIDENYFASYGIENKCAIKNNV